MFDSKHMLSIRIPKPTTKVIKLQLIGICDQETGQSQKQQVKPGSAKWLKQLIAAWLWRYS